MLLSDGDIRKEIASGRVVIEPWDPEMVQPSSIDVRIDRYFRVFENHRYPHIDPAEEQPDLTRLVEITPGEPLILHPGEFVLGSILETVTLPDDVAARGAAFDEPPAVVVRVVFCAALTGPDPGSGDTSHAAFSL